MGVVEMADYPLGRTGDDHSSDLERLGGLLAGGVVKQHFPAQELAAEAERGREPSLHRPAPPAMQRALMPEGFETVLGRWRM